MEENNVISPEELAKENESLKAQLRATVEACNERIKEVVNEAEKRILERDYANAINRVKLLQECVAHADAYSKEFIKYVVSEIENTLTVVAEANNSEENTEDK